MEIGEPTSTNSSLRTNFVERVEPEMPERIFRRIRHTGAAIVSRSRGEVRITGKEAIRGYVSFIFWLLSLFVQHLPLEVPVIPVTNFMVKL